MIAATTMSEHEKGYRAAKAGTHEREWKDHWSGAKPSTQSADWFSGYQDALDDTAMGNPPMYALPLSSSAVTLQAYCAAHSKPSVSCDGKRAVFINWRAMAEAIGLPDAGTDSTLIVLAAMEELHAAGILSRFDHGPGTFGHTSTIYNG